MYGSGNKVLISDVASDVLPTELSVDIASNETSISVASTSQFTEFEGAVVSAANTGYAFLNSEIISYTSVGISSLGGVTRGTKGTNALNHLQGDAITKYEFNGVSLGKINTEHSVETSLVGSAFRLLGWTMTTAMWSKRPPITGARINGTRERPGIAACFNDINGKPFALQLDPDDWQEAMKALNFFDVLTENGLIDLGLAFESEIKKTEILDKLAELFSTDTRDNWISVLRKADMISTHVNTMLEASDDPNIKENNYVTEVWYPELNKNMKVHGTPWKFSKTPANIKRAPKLGEHNSELLNKLGYSEKDIQNLIEDKII